MNVTRHRSLDEVPDWDEVGAPPGFYTSAAWLRMFEVAKPTYIAIRDGARLVAALPCWLIPRPGDLSAAVGARCQPAEVSRIVTDLSGATPIPVPLESLYPHLSTAVPLGSWNPLLVRPSLTPEARREAIATLVAAVRQLGRELGARTTTISFVPRPDLEAILAAAPESKVAFAASYASMELRDDLWERRCVKSDLKGFAAAGLSTVIRRLSEVVEPAAGMLVEHERKYGVEVSHDAMRGFLQRMIALHDARTRVACVTRGSDVVALCLHLLDRTKYYTRIAAAQAGLPKSAGVIFHCMFYAPIRLAAEDGVTAMDLGGAAIEGKVKRGAIVRTLWTAVLPGEPWPDAASRHLVTCSRARLASDLAELRRALRPGLPEEMLELPQTEALIARGA